MCLIMGQDVCCSFDSIIITFYRWDASVLQDLELLLQETTCQATTEHDFANCNIF